jgi:hypothetical protein
MTKEHEYRVYAGACVELANKATNLWDKMHLLAVAEAWLGLADRVQGQFLNPTSGRCIRCFGRSWGG